MMSCEGATPSMEGRGGIWGRQVVTRGESRFFVTFDFRVRQLWQATSVTLRLGGGSSGCVGRGVVWLESNAGAGRSGR